MKALTSIDEQAVPICPEKNDEIIIHQVGPTNRPTDRLKKNGETTIHEVGPTG